MPSSSDKKSMKKYNTRSTAVKSGNAMPTKDVSKKSKTHENTKRRYKKNHMSSDEEEEEEEEDDNSSSYETESEYSVSLSNTDEEEEDSDAESDATYDAENDEADSVVAEKEYQKFLYELFPSQFMKKKMMAAAAAAAAANINKSPPPNCKSKMCKAGRDKKKDDRKPPTNFNISFVIDDLHRQSKPLSQKEALYDEEYDEEDSEYDSQYDEDESEYDEEDESDYDEDEEDDESDYDEEDDEDEDDYVEYKKITKNQRNKHAADKHAAVDKTASLKKLKDLFGTLSEEDKNCSIVQGVLKQFKNEEKAYLKTIEKKTKKEKTNNTQKLKSLLKEKDVMNDLKFFNEKMTIEEQQAVLSQIELIHKSTYTEKPYRLSLVESDIPIKYKASAYRKITTLRHMEPGGGEYYKMKNWVDTFMQIPFGKYKSLPLTLDDGVEKCHEFMDNAKKILDQAVYGLNDVKLQIMQMVGQWIVNPSAIGTAIAIKGPMGTGKTTLVKEGISKILGRDFAFIALGGATDSSFLEGHSYTYEGSTWGKIVDLLIKCKSMNPVIYFDELDKISDTPKGEEIAGILTHLTDSSQNSQFHDRYFSEIDFDLSRCLFIFSYNDESKVNRILLDRMYKIQTKGYNQAQKTTIANNYLLPKIGEQVKFTTSDITIAEKTMHYIIDNYTEKEDGVRTLKRCLEIIYTKLNLYRLMKPDTNIFENDMSIKVEFPMTVTTEIVDKLIKKEVDNGAWSNMYM